MSGRSTETVSIRAPKAYRSEGAMRRMLRRVVRNRVAMVAFAWLVIVVLAAVFAPWLAPYDPTQNDFYAALQGPSAEHWLGTDENGRDVLSRIIFGARIALIMGVGAVIVAMLIGVTIGSILGFYGGWTDRVGTRLVDVFDALPGLLIAFTVIAILGRGLFPLLLAIGLIFSMNFARMSRAIMLAERNKIYVDAARVSGLKERVILVSQVLPNLAGPLIVQGSLLTGAAITIESALSFLGIGLETTVPSWGGLLGVAATQMAIQPFLAIPPGLAIVSTVLAFNLLGDGLSEALGVDRRKPFRRVGRRVEGPEGVVSGSGEVIVPPADASNILELRGLTVELQTPGQPSVDLVKDVSLSIRRGEILGVIGESGSGKSTLARAVLGVLAPGLGISRGRVILDGQDIADLSARQLRAVRGSKIAAVFQDPLASLSPVHTIGVQLGDTLRIHSDMSRAQARRRAAELLERVGVRDAASRLDDYPHQFSGGMAQRVAIAIALAASPDLIVADEATSALDVTTQAQVLDLLLDLRDEFGLAILFITHDIGVVAEVCDRAAVMYRGEMVEVTEDIEQLFDDPRDPYTISLLAARKRRPRPRVEQGGAR